MRVHQADQSQCLWSALLQRVFTFLSRCMSSFAIGYSVGLAPTWRLFRRYGIDSNQKHKSGFSLPCPPFPRLTAVLQGHHGCTLCLAPPEMSVNSLKKYKQATALFFPFCRMLFSAARPFSSPGIVMWRKGWLCKTKMNLIISDNPATPSQVLECTHTFKMSKTFVLSPTG